MSRAAHTELVSAHARCACGKIFDAKNAQPLAAKHHDKTGHIITLEKTERITYGVAGSKGASRSSKQQARLL